MPLQIPDNAVLDEEEKAPALQIPGNAVVESTPEASILDKAKAFGQGTFTGVADALPIAGAIGGTIAGATVTAPTGPGAVGGGMAGGTLGAAIGTSGRQALLDFTDVPNVEDIPEHLRPYYYGGQTFSGALPFGGIPALSVKTGFRTAGRFFDRAIETFMRKPKAFLATEGAAAAGGAVGEGVAESALPGNDAARLTGGVIGSVAAPGGLVLTTSSVIRSVYGRAAASMTASGRQSAAAAEIQRVLAEAGEDPIALADGIAKARRLLPSGANPTTGQLTGNPTLMAMEAALVSGNTKVDLAVQKQGQQSLEALRVAADALSASGDPGALREAAALRQEYFTQLLDADLASAERAAVDAADRIGPTDERGLSELSREASRLLDDSLQNARAKERELYALVPDGPAGAESIIAEANRIETEDLATVSGDLLEQLPPLARRFVARASEPDASVTIDELRKLRSSMLDEARKAAAQGDNKQARIYGKLAEAALDDLAAVTAEGGALDVARSYSRALNDTYTRSFAGAAEATAGTGARRLPPELLLRRAAGTGQEVGALRLRELREAVSFGSPEAGEELLGMQEQFIRTAADALVNPETGVVSPRSLATFRRRHAETLNEFPALKEQLSNAEGAARFLKSSQDAAKGIRSEFERDAFARVAGAENPATVVSRVLNGSQPATEFRALATQARLDSPAAVAGLLRSTMDEAFQRAGGVDNFSFTQLRKELFTPRRGGEQQSTVDLLRRNNVMDAESLDRLNMVIKQGEAVEEAMKKGGEQLDDLLANENALTTLLLRISGAKIGTAAAGATGGAAGGHSLIAAAAGSAFTRRVLDKVPTLKVQEVLVEAAKDPVLMETLLRQGKSAKDRIHIAQKLNMFLLNLGLVEAPKAATDNNETE